MNIDWELVKKIWLSIMNGLRVGARAGGHIFIPIPGGAIKVSVGAGCLMWTHPRLLAACCAMISFKMTHPLVDFDIFINHHFQEQIKNYRMAMMRYEEENSGLLDPHNPSIAPPFAVAGPEQPQSAWQ